MAETPTDVLGVGNQDLDEATTDLESLRPRPTPPPPPASAPEDSRSTQSPVVTPAGALCGRFRHVGSSARVCRHSQWPDR